MRNVCTLAVMGIAILVGVRAEARVAGQAHPDPVTVDPDHYSVEFETDAVRALRIRYGAGESSVMHYHPAHCAVMLTDMTVRFELPGGETVDEAGEAGDVLCVDAGLHKPSNLGDEPFEAVAFELRGRETLSP